MRRYLYIGVYKKTWTCMCNFCHRLLRKLEKNKKLEAIPVNNFTKITKIPQIGPIRRRKPVWATFCRRMLYSLVTSNSNFETFKIGGHTKTWTYLGYFQYQKYTYELYGINRSEARINSTDRRTDIPKSTK